MRFFYGACRRLSTLPILVFVVGWGFYLVGFLRKMIKPTLLLPRWDNYPSIIAAGVGPVFVLTALLQSCLSGTASAAVGSITATAAVIFLVSVGNSSLTSAQTLYQYNSSTLNTSNLNGTSAEHPIFFVSCTLIGSILCCLSVTVLLSQWGCYRSPPRIEENEGPITLHHDDDTSSMDSHTGNRSSAWFPGYSRKLAIPCILLAFVGWGLLVGGHYHRINAAPEEGRYNDDVFVFDFGQWGACVLTPLLLVFGLVHAGCTGSASVVMGVVNAILNGVVLVSIGYDMVHDVGGWLKRECEIRCDYTLPRNVAALCEIVGSFVVCFFWSSALAMWPHYRKCSSVEREGYVGLLTPSGYGRRANSRDYMEEEETEIKV